MPHGVTTLLFVLLAGLLVAVARGQSDYYDQYLDTQDEGSDVDKRAWNSGFNSGMGKRAWNSGFNSGMGKRAWNSGFNSGMGKRSELVGQLLKRAWNSNFSGGLGKRAWNSAFSSGMGKRKWNSGFSGGMGKRFALEASEGVSQEVRKQKHQRFRRPKSFAALRGMWGKRAAVGEKDTEAKRGGEEEVDDRGQDDQDDDLEDDVGRGVVKQDGVQDGENGRCQEEKSEPEIEATRSKKPFYYMVPPPGWTSGDQSALVRRGGGEKRTRTWMQLRGMWGRRKRGDVEGEGEHFYPLQHPKDREDAEILATILSQT